MSRFKELRLARGLTQGKLAKELGTSQQTISRIEFRDELIPTDILIKASEYYNVSIDYILGLSDERSNQTCQERMYQYLAGQEDFMMEFTNLKPKYQKVVKSVVRTLAEEQAQEQKA